MKKIDILSIQIKSDIEMMKKAAREGYYDLADWGKDLSKVLDKMIMRNEMALGIFPKEEIMSPKDEPGFYKE